ncbi:MAG: YidC/Oxa1 family membrane protein insertase [Solirubrobacteraceae bacterium]
MRFLAAVVDAAALIGGMGAVASLGVAGVAAYARLRGDVGDVADGPPEIQDPPEWIREPDQERASPWPDAMLAASEGLGVATRNWRGAGFHVLGLRRVDARTGGPITVRSAVIGVLFDRAWSLVTGPPFAARAKREHERLNALAPQAKEIERTYEGDQPARVRAMMQLYKENRVNPFAGCGQLFLGGMASQLVLALGSRNGRTVRDRVTGTMVIVDR